MTQAFIHRRIALLLGILASPAIINAHAAELSCETANSLAQPAFNRILEAAKKDDMRAAHHYKMAFWDVYQLAKYCTEIATRAKLLTNKHLGVDDDPPVEVSAPVDPKLFVGIAEMQKFDHCYRDGKWTCTIIITQGPSGNPKGLPKAPGAFFFDPYEMELQNPQDSGWKKLDATTIQKFKQLNLNQR